MDLNQSQFRLKSDSHELTLLVGSNLSSLFSPGEKGDTGDSAYQAWETLNPGGTVSQFLDSIKGIQGDKGDKGDQGDSIQGPAGLTAYELWEQSNPGQTLNDFLEAYRGTPGTDGTDGTDGDDFTIDAIDTFANRSNYDAEATGFVFYASDTQEVHIRRTLPASWSPGIPLLQGPKGDKGDAGDKGDTGDKGDPGLDGQGIVFDDVGLLIDRNVHDTKYPGFTYLDSDSGEFYIRSGAIGFWNGPFDFKGDKGDQGDTGLSAYEVAVADGYIGNIGDWLISLIGPKGDKGDEGIGVPIVTPPMNVVDYVVTDTDFIGGYVRRMDSVGALTVTVNSGITGAQPASFIRTNTGTVTFVAGAGVTIVSADARFSLRAQYSTGSLIPDPDTADLFYLVGDLV